MTTIRPQKQSAPSSIQRRSLPSVSVFWLNVPQVVACLKEAATTLATAHPEIEEVWLFGSLARGEAVPGSDADLLIVLSASSANFLDRAVRYLPGFCGVGVDVLAYTRAELAEMLEAGHSILAQVRTEGVCLYRKAGAPPDTA